MAEEYDEIRFEDNPAPAEPAPEPAPEPATAPAPARNQDVLDMIATVRARLTDLEDAVRACEADLPGFAQKLDRIDDRVYLLETEVAKHAAGQVAPAPVAAGGEGAPGNHSEKDDAGMNILTPEAKEKLGEFAGDLREVAKTGAETLADLNEAFSDITSPFKAFTKSGRRR